MKLLISYLVIISLLSKYLLFYYTSIDIDVNIKTYILSSCVSTIGGTLYCIRGIYLHKLVFNDWKDKWILWYLLRPFVSSMIGIVSVLVLNAGLLVLDSETSNKVYGFLIISFIAGYNVDNFLKKVEELGDSMWGIKKSKSYNK